MEILRVIRLVLALEPGRQLSKEELENIAQLVLRVGRLGRVQAQNVREAARGVRLHAAVLVQEEGGVRELCADGAEGGDVDVVLLERGELLVERFELFEEGVGGVCASCFSGELFVECETFFGGGCTGAGGGGGGAAVSSLRDH